MKPSASSAAWASPSPTDRKSRTSSIVSTPSTRPPITRPATKRTPSISTPGNCCAPTPPACRSAPWRPPKPPVRIIAPGSAYRRDEIDATHLSVFNQLEGLYVGTDVSLPDLKGTLEYFLHELFGPQTEVRFRPHFFPFTEPSFEIDVKLTVKGQAPRWIEVAGCGMVDPAVFESINKTRKDNAFDPETVTGFAFGMGLDRLAMIRWGIKDIRLLIENDVRFLKQFA